MEKQTLEIQELKKMVKAVSKKAVEATAVPVKKAPTMASRLAAIVAASPQPENGVSFIVPRQA